MKRTSIIAIVCIKAAVVGCASSAPGATAAITLPPALPTQPVGSSPTARPTRTPFVAHPTEKEVTTPTAVFVTSTPKPTATPEVSIWSSKSPDGQWIAEGSLEGPFWVGEQGKYRTQLRVISADGSVEWTVVDEVRNWGLGYTYVSPFHWSRDGQYLYFTNVPVPDGCGMFVDASDLLRVDLTSGQVTEVLPPIGWTLSLSPDENTLAYLTGGETVALVLRDLETDSEARMLLPRSIGSEAGNIVWSPDGSALLIATAPQPCAPRQSIVRVDLPGLSPTALIRDDERWLRIAAWPEVGRALLKDKDGNLWWMDAMTGQLTPAQ